MANLTKRYLDYDGLVVFLNNLKEYIADRISEINGSNINAYDKDEDNPLHTTDPDGYKTIAEQLQALWEAIGVGGDGSLSITEKIENIIGEYVKAINTPTSQTLPLKLKIEEGTGDDKDRFTISLEDNGLADKLDALTANRVSKLEVGDDGGAATLSIDKSTGDVKITINSKALTERVETLESHDGKYSGNPSNDTWNHVLSGRKIEDYSNGWKNIKESSLAISSQGKYSEHHTVLANGGLGKGLAIGTGIFDGYGIVMGALANSYEDYLRIGPNHCTGGIRMGSSNINIGNNIEIGYNDDSVKQLVLGVKPSIGSYGEGLTISMDNYNNSVGDIMLGIGTNKLPYFLGIKCDDEKIDLHNRYIGIDAINSITIGSFANQAKIFIGQNDHSPIDISNGFLKIGSITSLGTDIKTLQISCGSNASLGSAATKAGMFINENSIAIGSFDLGLSAMYTKEDLYSTDYRGFIRVRSSKDESSIMALGGPDGFNLISDSNGSLIEHGTSPLSINLGTDYLVFGDTTENPGNVVDVENQVFGLAVMQAGINKNTIILGSTPGYNNIIINNDGISIGNNFISLNSKNNDRYVEGVKFIGKGKMEGSLTGDVTGTASNATNLNNQPATYYAKQSDMTSITERVEAIESDWIKDIAVSVTSTATNPKYITLEENDNNGDSTITLSEVALCEKFEAVDNNVTVNATNIANETTARENADTALDGRLTDVESVQSNLASQIQALSLGMKVVGSASPSTFFKGNAHTVTVTATVQNMPSGFAIEEIKMGNTNAAISDNKGTITESVKLSGTTNSKSWNISAKVSGIPFTASASVSARYPIFYGMDENNNGLPKSLPTTIDYSKMNIGSYGSSSSITGCKLKRDKYRTSARGYSYEKISNSTATPMNFFVLVPSDVSQPTGFTMGGAPFVMDTVKTSTYTIDGVGVTYYIYKSGGIYLNGGSVTLGLS